MSILICSTKYGGCGFVGPSAMFTSVSEDCVICPKCREDHTFQVIRENIHALTDADNYEEAHMLLTETEKQRAAVRAEIGL